MGILEIVLVIPLKYSLQLQEKTLIWLSNRQSFSGRAPILRLDVSSANKDWPSLSTHSFTMSGSDPYDVAATSLLGSSDSRTLLYCRYGCPLKVHHRETNAIPKKIAELAPGTRWFEMKIWLETWKFPFHILFSKIATYQIMVLYRMVLHWGIV